LKSYVTQIFDYVVGILPPWQSYVSNPLANTDEVMMIGHSLGGGIANIIASKEYQQYIKSKVPPRITSFGVSPVGTVYSSKKFGFSWQAVTVTETSVWAQWDIIPKVDRHMGLYEVIPCMQASFIRCHSVLNTLCQLWRQCSLPKSALRQAEKESFLNCICCSEGSVALCASNVIKGSMWNRSCVVTH